MREFTPVKLNDIAPLLALMPVAPIKTGNAVLDAQNQASYLIAVATFQAANGVSNGGFLGAVGGVSTAAQAAVLPVPRPVYVDRLPNPAYGGATSYPAPNAVSPFILMPDGTTAQAVSGGVVGGFIYIRADGSIVNTTGNVLKDGAWIEVTIPGQGDPTAEQKLAAEAAKRKRLYLIGGIVLFSLIILLLVVKTLKNKKQN